MSEPLPLDAVSPIAIAGAGSVGQWVGAMLAAAGRDVALLGRPALAEAAERNGLRATDGDGGDYVTPPAPGLAFTDPARLADADVIVVTTKGRDTEAMGKLIAEHARADAVVVSLQNGVANPDRLRRVLPGWDVRTGMIGFNVVMRAPGDVHRATGGHVMVASGPRPGLGALLTVPGLPVQERGDMDGVAWTKMLINLNNALNALSGLPLYDEITHSGWRKLWAASIREGLAEAKAAGVRPVRVFGPPPPIFVAMLSLPTPLFKIIAARAFKVDKTARSSMADDLAKGRPTEVDDLQGEIVRRAEARGARASVCAATLALVKECEAAGPGAPPRAPEDVWERAAG